MKCQICKTGETSPGMAVVTLTRDEQVAVFKKVPAEICTTCGEEYLDSGTTRMLLQNANESFKEGIAVAVRDYRAA